MLHDSLTVEQTVDAEAALEFMKEATKLATSSELEDVGERLESKHRLYRGELGAEEIGDLDEAGFRSLLDCMFSLRRRATWLLKKNGLERLRAELTELLHGEVELDRRFDRFLQQIETPDHASAVALASEALHFSDPGRYWLWTYWIWNPNAGNGALRLVTHEIDLGASSDGEVYRRVGEATALLDAHGQAAGYSRSGRGLFGTDIFLACVYAVYMYTAFRIKLSQEFNRILPELPELVQRVLGVRRLGGPQGAPLGAEQGAPHGA